MGDARSNYAELTYGFFDRLLKGEKTPRWTTSRRVTLLHDGLEQVAVVGYLAAEGRAAADVLSRERRQGEYARAATAS